MDCHRKSTSVFLKKEIEGLENSICYHMGKLQETEINRQVNQNLVSCVYSLRFFITIYKTLWIFQVLTKSYPIVDHKISWNNFFYETIHKKVSSEGEEGNNNVKHLLRVNTKHSHSPILVQNFITLITTRLKRLYCPSLLYEVKWYFWNKCFVLQSATTSLSAICFLITNRSFQMRFCMKSYL